MSRIVFIDTEVHRDTGKVVDYGAVDENGGNVHTGIEDQFISFIGDAQFICGHNILNHDLNYIRKSSGILETKDVIDTLHLSPLLFPTNPYHKLVKDDKLQIEDLSNPVNDSIKAKELFLDELNAYKKLSQNIKDVFTLLLKDKDEFKSFFKYVEMKFQKPIYVFWTKESVRMDVLMKIARTLDCKVKDLFEIVDDENDKN